MIKGILSLFFSLPTTESSVVDEAVVGVVPCGLNPLFSCMFCKISGYFLQGINGLFWFHFDKIAPSWWFYLALFILYLNAAKANQ